MTPRRHSAVLPWYLWVLAAVAVAMIVLAVTEIGVPASSARTSTEIVQAQDGVVQSTVTGTGNVEPATDQTVNFRTSGTLQTVNVSIGQHVTKGQLIATLDPSSAELALSQAQANLTAAEDQLTAAQQSAASSSSTAASLTGVAARGEFVSLTPAKAPPVRRAPTGGTRTVTVTVDTPMRAPSTSGSSGSGGGTQTTSAATKTSSAAQIAAAQASVDSAEASLRTAEAELADTKLYAPVSGTIASLQSVSPGQAISAGSGSGSGSGGSTTGSGSAGSGGSGGANSPGSLGGSSSSSGSGSNSSSSGSGFAEIIDSSTLTMTVAFSESDITSVRVGQPATVAIDALSGVELAGHVTSISPLGTTSSGVVSYDATITLDQTTGTVRPGMSATATVITRQAQGVTVPNQAISGTGAEGTVEVEQGGRTVSQPVLVGLRGASRTQIVSGLRAGEDVVITVTLPALGTTTSSGGSGTLGGSGFGGGLFRGGGAGLLGGGGGGFLRRAAGGG